MENSTSDLLVLMLRMILNQGEIERLSWLPNEASDVVEGHDVASKFTDQLVVLATPQSVFVFTNSRTGLWSE